MIDIRANHQRRIGAKHRALHEATEVLAGMTVAAEVMPQLEENVYWLGDLAEAERRRAKIVRSMELVLDAAARDGFSQEDFSWD
jgi:hypothetical protein